MGFCFVDKTYISFFVCLLVTSHSLIFKLLFYTSNIFHLQIYLRIQVKSEILTII